MRTDQCARKPGTGPLVHRLVLTLSIAVFWVGLPQVVYAQTGRLNDAQVRLDKQERQLQAKLTREKYIQDNLKKLDRDRARLNERLLETAALIQKSEEQLTSIESRLGELQAQERIVRGSLNQQHGQIAKLLASLQRMGRNPPPVMITRREDALAMVRSAMLLASAFPGLRKKALALAEKLNELVRVMTDIKTEGDKLRTETERLRSAQVRLSGLMAEKKKTVSVQQAELSDVREAAADISRSVSDLTELIARLDKEVEKKAKSLIKHNRKVAATSAEPAAQEPITGGPLQRLDPPGGIEKRATPDGPKVAVLAPLDTRFGMSNTGRMSPAIPFHKARAKLPLPAHGKRILSFGEKTKYGGNSKGVVLQTRHSAQVTSPNDGWVVYAGEFRSYGQLLIINAGGGYHVLLAGLSRIDVQPGQFVLAAEPVGTMNDAPASKKGSAQNSKPVLYIEFRKHGKPIDPNPWWVASQQKVQG